MADKTYKNLFDDGYTTYHDDGTKSTTYKNLFDDGVTTYHSDGSKSKTYNNLFDDGTTTYHDDGTKSKTYKNILDDGYTTYNPDGTRTKSYTYNNLMDNGTTTYNYTYGQPTNTYNSYGYGDSYEIPSFPTGYYGAVSIDKTPYRVNENLFPAWGLALLWLAFGLLMLPAVWASFHTPEQTAQIMFTITCCLLASWSALHMIKRPGYSELFVCFILSFCMCMLHLMGGTWTMLLLLVPVGAVLDIYIFNKLGINYYGKLYTAYMWALGIMIVNAGFYLFKWQMGLQILMLVWLLLFLVFCVINLVQKIKNMIKTKQYASFNKMRSWILFAVGVVIPLVMEALLPAKAPLTIGIIGLCLYFVAGAALAGKDSNRQLLMYALCFGMITFTFCSLIRTQDAARNVVLQAFGTMDRQIGFALTQPVVAFVFRMIDWLANITAFVPEVITFVMTELAAWGLSFIHRPLPEYFALPNVVLSGAFCIIPILVCSGLGIALGKKVRKMVSKKK